MRILFSDILSRVRTRCCRHQEKNARECGNASAGSAEIASEIVKIITESCELTQQISNS